MIALPPGIEQHNGQQYYSDNGHAVADTYTAGPTVTTVSIKRPDGTDVPVDCDMYSTLSWQELGLPSPVLDAIYAKNYLKPSKIQAAVLPYICAPRRENMVVQAQNGAGKTACFTLSMLTIIDTSIRAPQAVVLAPTRELVLQTKTVVEELGKFIDLECVALLPRENVHRNGVTAQIVCGTPGKVGDLCKKGYAKFDRVSIFVLDEADVMLDQENQMGPQVAQIRKNFLPIELQVVLFSATYPPKVKDFAFKIVPNSHSVQLRKEQLNVKSITHLHKICYNDFAKYNAIKDLFGCLNAGQSIIFVNSRKKAFDLAKWLRDDDHAVSLICGGQGAAAGEVMDPKMRDEVMGEFRSGVTRVLVATDVLSRGIDVPAVTLVINYEFPRHFHSATSYNARLADGETYLHRVGRTGRFGMKGIAINLLDEQEKSIYFELLDEYKINSNTVTDDLEELEQHLRRLR